MKEKKNLDYSPFLKHPVPLTGPKLYAYRMLPERLESTLNANEIKIFCEELNKDWESKLCNPNEINADLFQRRWPRCRATSESNSFLSDIFLTLILVEDKINWKISRDSKCNKLLEQLFTDKAIMIRALKGSGKTQFAFDLHKFIRNNGAEIAKQRGWAGLKCVYHVIDSEEAQYTERLAKDLEKYLNNPDPTKVVLMIDEQQKIYPKKEGVNSFSFFYSFKISH